MNLKEMTIKKVKYCLISRWLNGTAAYAIGVLISEVQFPGRTK